MTKGSYPVLLWAIGLTATAAIFAFPAPIPGAVSLVLAVILWVVYFRSRKATEPQGTAEPEPHPTPAITPSSTRARTIIGTVVGISLVGVLIWSVASNIYRGDGSPNKHEAIIYCEDKVKERLKAPDTAKFSLESASSRSPFIVTGSVSSENSFGANLHISVGCTVTIQDENFSVRIDKLSER
ncbi:hypothetical protein J2Y69_002472 [Microbacterium resistens]|uniref:DUF4190 domain-containing protein n=1 Tax=Microbacterium resistens TaxID=156977 RepID=A0ABU1SE49_9MICO|nr:hypothetical protein [Microbacterium resistens]MDR6867864.1 hypothetical protein [Microbacterium resistens]